MMKTLIPLLLLSLAACGSSPDDSAAPSTCPPKSKTATVPGGLTGDLTEVSDFGDNPGRLKMFVHAPRTGKASAVVVALHGCTQGASDYVAAGWNELADTAGFAVVYPEQSTANNAQRCFRWFDKAHIARDGGEARSIAAMTEHAMTEYGATHAYVTGLSAGAAMTSVMLATYADIFEAGAIMAGLPYACATSQNDAYGCMSPGRNKSAQEWAALVPAAKAGRTPRVSIWHGDADWIVRPANETELVKQWTGVAGVAGAPSSTSTADGATHAEYKDSAGVVQVESWLVKGMGHGVALDPKDGCGRAGAYFLDKGLCSTTKAATFFGLVSADGTPMPSGNPDKRPEGTVGPGSTSDAKDCDP